MSHPSRILSDAVLTGGPVMLVPAARGRSPDELARERAIERAGHERGHADGLAAGREQGAAEGRRAAETELGTASEALSAALGQLAGERRRVLAELKDGALGLALAVARRIVQAELTASAETAARVVDAAVQHAQDATVVRVRVHPGDKERIERVRPDAGLELVADPAISPGGCVVETECGEVDATVESQWEVLRAAIAAEAERDEGRGTRDEGEEEERHPA